MAASSWRTAFLTLRDETVTSPPTIFLVNRIIFSNSDALIASLPNLSPLQVSSDIVFLIEMIGIVSGSEDKDDQLVDIFRHLSHLIYNVSLHVSFDMILSSWDAVIDSYEKLVNDILTIFVTKNGILGNAHAVQILEQCLKTLRSFSTLYQRTTSLAESPVLLNFLLNIVARFQPDLISASHSCVDWRHEFETGNRSSTVESVWKVQTTVFTMISEIYIRVGNILPVNWWLSAVLVFRKIMDVLAAKGFLLEDNTLAKFYTSLLHCLHLILSDPKGTLSGHVAGLVASLRMFFNYGLIQKPQVILTACSQKKEHNTNKNNKNLTSSGPYKPPHMRRLKSNQYHEVSSPDHMSSDSDYSDSDGSPNEAFNIHSSKARVAAIVCLQDLCQADLKSMTAQWTMFLPTSDVLQLRKCDANLMTCLLFDPYTKARLACASALAAMLDAPVSVYLQMAEYRDSTKRESYMSLSSSLGQILVQLHTGILYLVKHEKHSRLVASLFKVLVLLISSTPYSRLPDDLLSTSITSLHATVKESSLFRRDINCGLLAVAINCLTVALSVSSSSKVNDLFLLELSTGCSEYQGRSGVLFTLFEFSDPEISPVITFEALQALRAVAHNYPSIMIICWDEISSVVSRFLSPVASQPPTLSANSSTGHTASAIEEKIIAAAVKVLDECLRAITGFKGMEDLSDDKLLDRPFASDLVKIKTVSSAPLYGSGSQAVTTEESQTPSAGSMQWCISIDSHMTSVLLHTSHMVRSAAVTCFAGITSSVFLSLPKEKQDFVLDSAINVAMNDEVPSVRSAACRAIGVIACFTHISQSAEIVGKLIYAAEINTRSPMVRIASAWAIANICDSVRHSLGGCTTRCSIAKLDARWSSELIPLLIDCAMRLTKDGDKIKANAVRALGNLSRIAHLTSQSQFRSCDGQVDMENLSLVTRRYDEHVPFQQQCAANSHLLERMVHAFISCANTGNVKVQWNVCHALSNLFLNETFKLRDMDWAPSVYSILLSLLCDSSNFKIKIQAAAALAVPPSVYDYGSSFADVLQSVEEMLENLNSQQISTPSSFRYRIALQKQLTSTMLHLLGLASAADHQLVHEIFIRKSSFFEEWLGQLCLSLGDTSGRREDEHISTEVQKKEVILKALKSLVEIFEARNYHSVAQTFEDLRNTL
ncbi:uncharacterized protein LOC141672065 isoform X2 [Apium graveolens]|uniref:uncharacterized protein LOC141672065 isoform X2 n=1 Tax=Apium graveolens TaxID=4045 RepID=UPI003D79FC9A